MVSKLCSLLNISSLCENCTQLPTYVNLLICEDTMSVNAPTSSDIAVTRDDAAWILANAFLILTMQTGFGMLEAGSVSAKNVANIMMKNIVDVTLGGITYWCFGYALSFGEPSNAFSGFGNFFFSADGENMGAKYTHYVFQFSFATASTTIVSGAVAERMKFTSYMVFSAVNTVIYCIPASWVWNKTGFLRHVGFFDFAGACVVHLTGGASALVAAVMLGPRLGFTLGKASTHGMSSPVTALTGTFMLWWAWLAFSCGSTFGIQGDLWKTAAKVGVNTLNGSIGGSFTGIMLSVAMNWKNKVFDIPTVITSILAGLVSVTASSAVISPLEALVTGSLGAAIAVLLTPVLIKMGVDDPVNAVPVHFISAIWGVTSVGLFGHEEFSYLSKYQGVLHGGGFYLLGVQILGVITVGTWSMVLTCISFLIMKYTLGIRMNAEDEILGADWVEHRVRTENFATKLENALIDMKIKHEDVDRIASKLINELAASNMEKEVDSRIRNVAGPSAESSSTEQGIRGVVGKSLGLRKKVAPVQMNASRMNASRQEMPGRIELQQKTLETEAHSSRVFSVEQDRSVSNPSKVMFFNEVQGAYI